MGALGSISADVGFGACQLWSFGNSHVAAAIGLRRLLAAGVLFGVVTHFACSLAIRLPALCHLLGEAASNHRRPSRLAGVALSVGTPRGSSKRTPRYQRRGKWGALRAYVDYVSGIVIEGLAKLVELSLRFLNEQLDRNVINEKHKTPMLEIWS